MVENLGFDAVAFPEHHLHGEGLEMGGLPVLYQHVIHHTKRIKVGPIGYVLPGWNPLRLVLEIAWLDQLTKGRTLVGFARGYQPLWLNQMAQKIHVGATMSDKSQTDRTNREAFEEVFPFLKLAWADKPFRFKGKHYEYPSPYEKGTPWPPHAWTREFGTPGEVDENGRIQMINVVPKPYQKPHPPLFQAFSMSEETVRWCAREGITPSLLISDPDKVRYFAQVHVDEARKYGRSLELGQSLAVLRQLYIASDKQHARKLADVGMAGLGFGQFFAHFGFADAWRFPEDDLRYPDQFLPPSECTVDRQVKAHFTYLGTVADIRKEMDLLVEAGNPEWFIWQSDQGMLPIAEVKRQIKIFGEQVLSHYQ
jgi:alkanesulfonate monooxygenase SsuD/methylene tetrahydromethanopterin reductase-like flavin-dependent oxidoreductase (luciferase family)